jgi:hypothetical protein
MEKSFVLIAIMDGHSIEEQFADVPTSVSVLECAEKCHN